MPDQPTQLESVGVLTDPTRRRLYRYVVGQVEVVSREQAAEALGVPAHTVKFHLDKLAAAGLLEVEYRRLSGRTGPGAGRPAKVYRRSEHEVSLSVPPRRYDLAGEVLADAVDRSIRDGVAVAETLPAVARETGRRLAVTPPPDGSAEPAPGEAPSWDGTGDELGQVAEVLARYGYEPEPRGDELCLANCPFDRLAAQHTALVCGMNLALIDGVLDGVEADSLEARLEPRPGLCCVAIGPAPGMESGPHVPRT